MKPRLLSTAPGRDQSKDALLQDLLDAGNWKVALANCDKRIKKGEKSDRLALNRAVILLYSGDTNREAAGFKDLLELLQRKPPITDTQILLAAEDLCIHIRTLGYETSAFIDGAWERAASENPQDESIHVQWFRVKFAARNYKTAQKAALNYSRKFKGKRRPFYWSILALHLASNTSEIPETEKKVYSEMAYRLLITAVETTKSEVQNPAPGSGSNEESVGKTSQDSARGFRSPNDLQLLVYIYKSQGRHKDALAVLNHPEIGIRSTICNSSWELVREKLKLQEQCELWESLWRTCHDLLLEANPSCRGIPREDTEELQVGVFGNDWLVWESMIRAASKYSNPEISKRTKGLITSYIMNDPKSRNARLAMIWFYSTSQTPIEDDRDNLVTALFNYFREFSASSVCFEDLRCASRLSVDERIEFLAQIDDFVRNLPRKTQKDRTKWVSSEINRLKQDYALVISVDTLKDDRHLLEGFICTCLSLYRLSLPLGRKLLPVERRPGDDAAILAAMGCLRLYYKRSDETRYLLRCALILEFLIANSSHNYDAFLMLISSYLHLGAVSKAIKFYTKLEIKHIQNITNSWILFTRISTLHPHSLSRDFSAGKNLLNPADFLRGALSWALRNEAAAQAAVMKFMENDSLTNLLGYLKYSKISSLTPMMKKQYMIEIQRLSRLGHLNAAVDEDLLTEKFDYETEDVRNTSAFPNYEANGQPSLEWLVRPGPTPANGWIRGQLQIIELTKLVSALSSESPETFTHDFWTCEDMTNDEISSSTWNSWLLRVYGLAIEKPAGSQRLFFSKTLDQLLTRMKKMAQQDDISTKDPYINTLCISPKLNIPNWYYFHGTYVLFDQCCINLAWLEGITLLNSKSGYFPSQSRLEDALKDYKVFMRKCYASTQGRALKLKGILERNETREALVEALVGGDDERDIVGMELQKSVGGTPFLDDIVQDLVSSWQECLDGILQSKPPQDRQDKKRS